MHVHVHVVLYLFDAPEVHVCVCLIKFRVLVVTLKPLKATLVVFPPPSLRTIWDDSL